MYNADIEALVLSGELFNGKESSSSPRRTPSPDNGWHDDELSAGEKEAQKNWKAKAPPPGDDGHPEGSVGMGPGRTGVKGVIRDRNEAEAHNQYKRETEIDELRRRMEKSSLGGKTFLEEERERLFLKGTEGAGKVDPLVSKEREKEWDSQQDRWGRQREGPFGHLREIGVKSFVSAVENEERGVWVVIHLYAPSLERCFALDDTLTTLARIYPTVKFLRIRASALGFATTNTSTSTTKTLPSSQSRRTRSDDDEEEDEDYSDEEEEDAFDDDNVDLDMLPTMLVYRDGELVHNWVRVDWEAGSLDVEELLLNHKILPQAFSLASYNLGLPDDDADLDWGDLVDEET